MSPEDEQQNAPGEKAQENLRKRKWLVWPTLDLERPGRDARPLRPLEPLDGLYPLAAWVWHHAHELDETARSGLFVALEQAWPPVTLRGRPRTRRRLRPFVYALKKAGVSSAVIAAKYHRSPGDIDDLSREYGESLALRARGALPHLVVAEVALDGFNEPYDPSTIDGRLFAMGPDVIGTSEHWDRADELARELGYKGL